MVNAVGAETPRSTAPRFYTPEARDADIVQCRMGHEMLRDTALRVGRLEHSTWACPYCCYTPEQRQLSMRAYELGLKDGRAERKP
jgi:hypothetical protein